MAATALGVQLGAVPTEPEPCWDVWCQSGQCWWSRARAAAQLCSPRMGARGSAAAPGLEAGKVLWSNRAVTVAGKSKGRANNQAELSLLHLYFLSGLCQSVGPGNLLMVKEECVFTVLKVDLMGSFVM